MSQRQAVYKARSEIALTVPIPPSANRYWRAVPGRGVLVSQEARDYKKLVRYENFHIQPFTGFVAVSFSVFRPRKSGDLDNYAKVLLDALKGILYPDDNAVIEFHAFRYDDKKNPRVEVVAWEVPGV